MAFKFVYHNALFFQNIVGLNFLKSVNSFFTCVHEEHCAWRFTQDVFGLGVAATLASHTELKIFLSPPVSEEVPVDPATSP